MPFDLERWLSDLGLPQYIEELRDCDEETLPTLSDADLKELGVDSLPHRRKLLLAIGRLGQGQERPAAAPLPQDAGVATAPSLVSPPDRALNLFISYGRDGFQDEARALAAALTERGHQVWFDQRELREGHAWQIDIERGITACDWVILLMTPHSVRRPDGFCLKEITKAAELGKPIVPVLIEPVPGGAPLLICNVQYLDWRDAVPAAQRTERFQQSFARLCEAVEHQRIDFEGGQRTLLTHLNASRQALDFTRDTVDRLKGFTGRKWLVAEVERWLAQSSSRVFWLTGGPGIGKSAFAAHLCQERPEIKARHFCVHNNADRSDPRKALLSIIYQLSQQLPGYDKLLLELDLAEESRKDTSTIFDNLVVGLLGRIEPPSQTCVVVIDAVDEATQQVAGRGKHNEIAAMIRDHWSKTPPWLRLLITSRPEVEVRTALRSFDPWEFDAERAENIADLREYLERELRASGFAPTAAQIDTVIARSEGLFLYMKVVVQELREGRLSLARTQDFPRGLAGYYGRYFERQFPDIDRYRERIRGVLQTILAAREPLPLSVLQLSQPTWGTQELADFTQALGSLFVRSKQGSEETLAAFHKSLPDWLTDEAHAGLYFVSAADGHARLGRAGLAQFRGDRAGEMPGYLLRHLPAHLAKATLEAERREVLTDFGFAMRRAGAGFIDALLEDYRGERARALTDPLGSWAECLMKGAHLLKRGDERWPANRILLQVAVEEADDSAITQAAEAWLEQGHCEWVWVRNRYRPARQVKTSQLAVLEGHSDEVSGANFFEDGKIFSWSFIDKSLRIWDARNGSQLKVLEGHTSSIAGATSLCDGRIVSWSHDGTLIVWDSLLGTALTALKGHEGRVAGALVLPDGRLLSWAALSAWDFKFQKTLGKTPEDLCAIRLWDTASQDGCILLKGHSRPIAGAAIIDKRRLMSWSNDTTVRIWDLVSLTCVSVLAGHTLAVRGALSDPEGHILSWSGDKTLRLWDGNSGNCLQVLVGHEGPVTGAKYLKGDRILSWSDDRTLRIWDVTSGDEIATLNGHSDVIDGVISISDDRVASWSRDGSLRIWDTSIAVTVAVKSHPNSVNGALNYGEELILSWAGNAIYLWNDIEAEPLNLLIGHARSVKGAKIDANGRLLSWSSDATLRLWDLKPLSRTLGSDWKDITHSVEEVFVDKSIVMRLHDGSLEEVTIENGRLLARAFNRAFNAGDDDQSYFELEDSALKPRFEAAHTKPVLGARIAPNGTIVTWAGDSTLRLWREDFGEAIAVLRGHTKPVESVYWLPGDRILSASADGTLRIWEGLEGMQLAVVQGTGRIDANNFSNQPRFRILPDGRVLTWTKLGDLSITDATTVGVRRLQMRGYSTDLEAEILSDGKIVTWSAGPDLSEKGDLMVWDGVNDTPWAILEGHERQVRGLKKIDDDRMLSWSYDELRIWSFKYGILLVSLTVPGDDRRDQSIACTPVLTDDRILSLRHDSLQIWDLKDYALIANITFAGVDRARDVGVLSDKLVYVVFDDDSVRTFNASDGSLLQHFARPWVFNAAHPTPWDREWTHFLNAAKVGKIWTQATQEGVFLAERTGRWHCRWHSSGPVHFNGQAFGCLIYLSGEAPHELSPTYGNNYTFMGRRLLILQVMDGNLQTSPLV